MGREGQETSLSSPLIESDGEDGAVRSLASSEGEKEKGVGWRSEVLVEIKKQAWLAGPLISVSLLFYSLQMISLMFVGHLGELPLSGASMATSFATVTGFSLLVSLRDRHISRALTSICSDKSMFVA